jgi:hypothetical protein
MNDEELVKMARLAQRDDRMATGALYGDLADRIEQLINLNEALVELLDAARADAKEAEAYAEELEAKVKNLTKHHANMADPRYWEGRYRDEKAKLAKAVEALGSIELYGSDTLSGRTDGPADAKWHREGVKEMRDRARTTLAEIEGEKE